MPQILLLLQMLFGILMHLVSQKLIKLRHILDFEMYIGILQRFTANQTVLGMDALLALIRVESVLTPTKMNARNATPSNIGT